MKNQFAFIVFVFTVFCTLSVFGQLGVNKDSVNTNASLGGADSYIQDVTWHVSIVKSDSITKSKVNSSNELEVDADGRLVTLEDDISVLHLGLSDSLTIQFALPESAFDVKAIIEYNDPEEDVKGLVRWNNNLLSEQEVLLGSKDGGSKEVKLEEFRSGFKNKNELRIFTVSGSLDIINVFIQFKYRMPCYKGNDVTIKLTSPDPSIIQKLAPDLTLKWKGSGSCENGWIKIEYDTGYDVWKPVPGAESIAVGDAEWKESGKGELVWKNHGLVDFPKFRIVYSESENVKKMTANELKDQVNKLFSKKLYDDALEKVNELLELYPDNDSYKKVRDEIVKAQQAQSGIDLYEQAVKLSKENRYDEALEKLDKALELDPDNEDYIKAKKAILDAQEQTHADELADQADKLLDQNILDEALSKINEALKINPNSEYYKTIKQRIKMAFDQTPNTPSVEPVTPEPQPHNSEGHKAGERCVKVINGVEFAFRWCPAGTFLMGSPKTENGRYDNETPHQVTLTNGFWMMEMEVTQKQWRAVMGRNNLNHFQGDDLPVEKVSWKDCQEFCKKCTQQGLPVRLPTEVQWEYACRAGSTEAYAGNLDEMAWYKSNSGGLTHPVGTKNPNAWGLYDMHGNVCEWCADMYNEAPSQDVGHSNDSYRVYRGGGWRDSPSNCRSANRTYGTLNFKGYTLGFRCMKGQ